MEDLTFRHKARQRAGGAKKMALIGVVASGNLEVLAERVLPACANALLEIKTAADRASARSGTPWSPTSSSAIRPAGSSFPSMTAARVPDTVSLRLAQAVRLMRGGREMSVAADADWRRFPVGRAARRELV